MVFSSIQAYLDPSNWQQQQQQDHHQTIIGGSNSTHHPLAPPPSHNPPPPSQATHGGVGSIRSGSMSERARQANIPLPEAALKCPRCESTNTKFCYFNNYSLSQPRHFCKTCRRYWTRGGALRNVPVGGGYRRNKRSKSAANSKSQAAGNNATTSSTSNNNNNMSAASSGGGVGNNNITTANILGGGLSPHQLPPLRFMSSLGQLSTDGFAADVGLNYSGNISTSSPILGSADHQSFNNFHGSGNNLFGHGGMPSLFPSSGIEPWRLQQYPNFLGGGGGLEMAQSSAHGVYNQFHGGAHDGAGGFLGGETSAGGGADHHHHIRPNNKLVFSSAGSSSSVMSQLAAIKMEDNNSGMNNLSRQLLLGGMPPSTEGSEQWNNNGGNNNAWTTEQQPSSFRSSSTSNDHPL